MNNRVRYTRQNVISNSFYQLPRFLFDAEFSGLSNDARVLYALLRNRHEISVKNGWFDESGEVYIYFKREDMQIMLNLSENTIAKAMKDLRSYGLIEEERQGFAKPNKIYLLSAIVPELGIEEPEPITAKFEVMNETQENQYTRSFYGTETADFAVHEPQNLRPSYNNNNHNNINKNQVMSSQSELDGQDTTDTTVIEIQRYTEYIKNGIGYSSLLVTRKQDIELIDEFITIILDTVMTKSEYIRMKDGDKPRALVTGNLLKLTYSDIEYAIDQFKGVTTPISRKKQYILATLYNCKMELDAHYTNLVKSNMQKELREALL